jgi:hypothetical protein
VWLRPGGELGEGGAAPFARAGWQAGSGAAGVVLLPGVVGVQDALVADDQGAGEPERERGQSLARLQLRAMLVVAVSLRVELARSALVRRV